MIFEKPLIKAYLIRIVNVNVIIGTREVWNLPFYKNIPTMNNFLL